MLAAWEWAGICGWHTPVARYLYTLLMGCSLVLTYFYLHHSEYSHWLILGSACGWWLLASGWLWHFQHDGHSLFPTTAATKALLGIFILIPAWGALFILDSIPAGGQWVIFLLVLIWTADSSAYFVGRRWGRLKLADKISPGKTWEGVAGALFGSTLVALAFAGLWLQVTGLELLLFTLLCLLTVIASIIGDLLESAFKRQANLKDSGQLLPGHGGILDRIDSLTSAAPIFVMGLALLHD